MFKELDISGGIVQVCDLAGGCIETCKVIPFLPEQLYCYGQVDLSYYDKLFLVVMGAALLATFIGWIQGHIK